MAFRLRVFKMTFPSSKDPGCGYLHIMHIIGFRSAAARINAYNKPLHYVTIAYLFFRPSGLHRAAIGVQRLFVPGRGTKAGQKKRGRGLSLWAFSAL